MKNTLTKTLQWNSGVKHQRLITGISMPISSLKCLQGNLYHLQKFSKIGGLLSVRSEFIYGRSNHEKLIRETFNPSCDMK